MTTHRARRNRQRRRKKSKAKSSASYKSTSKSESSVQMSNEFRTECKVAKIDEELGIVFGWAVICKENGEDYYDVQGDHVEEDGLVDAVADFMEHSRVAKEMHKGSARGSVIFAFPMVTDIAKSLGIQTSTTGLLVGMKPDPKMLEKFKSGELTGFSIGGSRIEDEEVIE